MKKNPGTYTDATELRRRAEAQLEENSGHKEIFPSAEDARKQLHELQVHQIELEMQNKELRQSREQTEASLARFTEFFDFAPTCYLTLQRDGAIHEINLTGASLIGLERAKLIGRRLGSFAADQSKPAFDTFLQNIFANPVRRVCELSLVTEDKRPLFVHIEAISDQSGQTCRMSLVDITERKKAENALRNSVADLKEVQRIAHLGSWRLDVATNQVVWSEELYQMYGFDPTLPPPPYSEYQKLFTPESWERLSTALPNTRETGIPYELQLETIRKDGSRGWMWVRGERVDDESGVAVVLQGVAQDITARMESEAELLRLNRVLKTLSEGNLTMLRASSEMELMQNICDVITSNGDYLFAWIGLARQDENKSIEPVAISGTGKGYVEATHITWDDQQPSGRGPTGTAVRTGQTRIVQNVLNDPSMALWREAAVKYGYASAIALPLKVNEEIIGALMIYAAEPDIFGAKEVALLEDVANDLAFGIESLRTQSERDQAIMERQQYIERLRESLEDALQAIATTVEMRDPYTAGHQRRVADLAVAIAREMNLPEVQIHGIHLAGIVHDVGKVNIPTEILSKPGRLNEIELALTKTHAQSGYDILKEIEFPWPIAQAVLQHHERLDGSGYPQGLKGESIIPEARILAVADIVEAMSSHRPYRAGLGMAVALAEIGRGRGTQYDSSVVDACVRLFNELGYTITA